jgi:hypothetical protein
LAIPTLLDDNWHNTVVCVVMLDNHFNMVHYAVYFMDNPMKSVKLTHWCYPNEQLQSQYGLITYREWCLREVIRLRRKYGQQVRTITEWDSKICIEVDIHE